MKWMSGGTKRQYERTLARPRRHRRGNPPAGPRAPAVGHRRASQQPKSEEINEEAVDDIAPTVHNCTQLYTAVHNVMLSTASSSQVRVSSMFICTTRTHRHTISTLVSSPQASQVCIVIRRPELRCLVHNQSTSCLGLCTNGVDNTSPCSQAGT